MSNTMTIKGRLGQDPTLRFTKSGTAVANGSVADTPRRKNGRGEWEDAGDTLWQNYVLFGSEAERLAEVARKGDQVTLVGTVRAESWEKDGETRRSTKLVVDMFRVHESSGRRQQPQQQPQPQADPWGEQQAAFGADSEPPF